MKNIMNLGDVDMGRIKLPVLLCIFIFLGGCSLAPRYIKPNAPIPEQWPQGAAYKETAAAPGTPEIETLKWRDFFIDEKLREIIEIALDNNRDLRLAALNVERARGMYGIQRGELFPAVNAEGAGSKKRRSADLISTGEPRIVEQYDLSISSAAWELDFFGRIRSLSDQALEEYLATEQARRSTRILLMAEVARVYLTLAADKENFKLARATLETQQASYDLIEKSYKIGLATEIDLRRAQTQVDTARKDLPRFTRQAAQDRNALNLLAGYQIPEALLPADLNSVVPPGGIAPGLSSEVLLNRPDIVAAEHRLKGAYAYVGAARASLFPRISLTTSLGTASNELSGLFESGSGTWSFAPQLSLPIFDSRIWAALRVSKTDRKIILTRYEKTIQTAFREVADALAVQGTINEQISAQESLVTSVSETYRLSNKRYKMGIDNYLSVLDAHRSLYAQQQALILLHLTKLANQVTLYSVLGGGSE